MKKIKFKIKVAVTLFALAALAGYVAARFVSAAGKTFDSDILPTVDDTYSVGLQGNQLFKDAYFSGNLIAQSSLSIGSYPSPTAPFSVSNNTTEFLFVNSAGQVYFNNLVTIANLDAEPPTSTLLNGSIYYNSLTARFRAMENLNWLDLIGGVVNSYWSGALPGDIYNNNTGNVGIGFRRTQGGHGPFNQQLNSKLVVKGTIVASGLKFSDGRTWTIGKNSVFSSADPDAALVAEGYINNGRVFDIGTTPYYLYQR